MTAPTSDLTEIVRPDAPVAAHTPGPWQLGDINTDPEEGVLGEIAIMADAPETPSGKCFPAVALPFAGWPFDVALANARLIAAAPELLAACNLVIRLMDNGTLVRDITKDGQAGWAMAALDLVRDLQTIQAAIAKATGSAQP